MPKEIVSEERYIAELNRMLQLHAEYQPGMAFLPAPEGAQGRAMTGYSVTGPFALMGVYATVAQDVASQFTIN